MAVDSTINKDYFTGNGSLAVYTTTFIVNDVDDLEVYLNDSLQSLSYTSVLNANNTVTVTFSSAPASGVTITLLRATEQLQSVSFTRNSTLDSAVMEGRFDVLTEMIQDTKEIAERALRVKVTENFDPELPTLTGQAGYLKLTNGVPSLSSPIQVTVGSIDGVDTDGMDNYGVTTFNGTSWGYNGALLTLDTINALRTTSLTDTSVYIKGHTTDGDGGEGIFRLVTGAGAGTYTDDNGTIIVPSGGDGSAAWLRHYSGAVKVEWFGGSDIGEKLNNAINSIAASDKGKIILPSGNYSFSTPIVINNYFITIEGDCVLTYTGSGTAISLATTTNIESITIKGIFLFGNSSAVGGLQIGDTNNHVSYLRLQDVSIRNFTNTNAFGIGITALQEGNFDSVQLRNNYYNIYSDGTRFITTAKFHGYSGYCGLATRHGVYVGNVSSSEFKLVFENMIFESNAYSAIYSAGGRLKVWLKDCYCEYNNSSDTSAPEFYFPGSSGSYNEATLVMDGHEFHNQQYSTDQIELGYCIAKITNCTNLDISKVTTTTSSRVRFEHNSFLTINAADSMTLYKGLLGDISVLDKDYGTSFYLPGANFELGHKYFLDNFSIGEDLYNTNDRTKNGFKIISGNFNYGNCASPVSNSLLRLDQSSYSVGAVAWVFFKVNQLYNSGYARSAGGILIGSSAAGGATITLTPSLNVTSGVSGVDYFTITSYTSAVDTNTIDMGLTITSTGSHASSDDVCVEWFAIISGLVTAL